MYSNLDEKFMLILSLLMSTPEDERLEFCLAFGYEVLREITGLRFLRSSIETACAQLKSTYTNNYNINSNLEFLAR